MAATNSLAFRIFEMAIVLAVVLIIFSRGNAEAGELGERFDSVFDKDLLVLDARASCMKFDEYEKLLINGVVIADYKEFTNKETFIFTASLTSDITTASPKYQIASSNTITGERKDGQWEFPSEPVIEFSLDHVNAKDVDGLLAKGYLYVTVWKSAGLDASRRYDVTFEKLVEQKADFYIKTFKVSDIC